jgi:hypothetical protein
VQDQFIVSEITYYYSFGFGLREMRYYLKHRTGLTPFCITGPELFYVSHCDVADSIKHRVYYNKEKNQLDAKIGNLLTFQS